MPDRPFPLSSGTELSPEGRTRRGVMLGELLVGMQRVHRRRRHRRLAVAAAHLVALAIAVSMIVPSPSIEVSVPSIAPARVSRVNVAFVKTDPAVLERYLAAPSSRAAIVDDQMLLGALAAIDRPTGLIRQGGRVWLTQDVLAPR